MSRRRNYWLAIGVLVATGATGVVLSLVALSGFESSTSGDVLLSPNPTTVAGLAIVLLALTTRIALELIDASSRRPIREPLARAEQPGKA